MGYIYKITNLINNKIYIGQTSFSIELRFKQHIYIAKNNFAISYPLYEAMRKYGVENFVIEEMEEVNDSELDDREKYWIKEEQSFIKYGKGYNCTLGGEGNILIDREKIYNLWDEGYSISQINEMYSFDRSSIRKILQNYKNYNIDESNKRGDKIQGKARRKKIFQYDKNGKFIKEYSCREEAEEKTGISAKTIWSAIDRNGGAGGFFWSYNKKNSIEVPKMRKYRQKVAQYNGTTLIKIYESAAAAKKETGISDIQIRKVCQGKGKTAGGFIWRYYKN